jgi:hypothetical protein
MARCAKAKALADKLPYVEERLGLQAEAALEHAREAIKRLIEEASKDPDARIEAGTCRIPILPRQVHPALVGQATPGGPEVVLRIGSTPKGTIQEQYNWYVRTGFLDKPEHPDRDRDPRHQGRGGARWKHLEKRARGNKGSPRSDGGKAVSETHAREIVGIGSSSADEAVKQPQTAPNETVAIEQAAAIGLRVGDRVDYKGSFATLAERDGITATVDFGGGRRKCVLLANLKRAPESANDAAHQSSSRRRHR